MTSRMYIYTAFLVGAIGISSEAFCAKPVWTFSAPIPAIVNITNNETKSVQYTVTNQSSRAKNLFITPTPGLSASSCVLAGKGSTCSLTINIHGNEVPEGGILTGPVLCQQGNPNQCYQPSQGNQLNVVKNGRKNILTAAGRYRDNTSLYPMLAQSTDGGLSWSYKIDNSMGLPNDYDNLGLFNSTSTGHGNFLPSSLSWLSANRGSGVKRPPLKDIG